MNDLIIQFARLWGQLEAAPITGNDEEIRRILTEYDSEDMLSMISRWADEFMKSDEDDTCDFFYSKVEELTGLSMFGK